MLSLGLELQQRRLPEVVLISGVVDVVGLTGGDGARYTVLVTRGVQSHAAARNRVGTTEPNVPRASAKKTIVGVVFSLVVPLILKPLVKLVVAVIAR